MEYRKEEEKFLASDIDTASEDYEYRESAVGIGIGVVTQEFLELKKLVESANIELGIYQEKQDKSVSRAEQGRVLTLAPAKKSLTIKI